MLIQSVEGFILIPQLVKNEIICFNEILLVVTFCTVTLEAVDTVDTEAAVSTGVRETFVDVHLTESTWYSERKTSSSWVMKAIFFTNHNSPDDKKSKNRMIILQKSVRK
jgi:hypothetical protein